MGSWNPFPLTRLDPGGAIERQGMRMTVEELCSRLASGEIVVLAASAWGALEGQLEVVETHDTFMSGLISVRRGACGLVAVEQPKPEERVVRAFADAAAARAFVEERLATYERMWNGCGCKVEYYR